ncbi:hypothetical protein F4860DRAFT_484357 [Xylaria cubensis]|nr:hypothetical protein F4860DRAFT_484357 [Xylaria cubensis]
MDPVSAVGVAAAAVQFLDASIKAYSAFQEIRSSVESSTERNKQLEDNIRAAKDLRGSLISASISHDPMTELAKRCDSKASELLDLLVYVRGVGEHIGSIRVARRAFSKGKQIEKLHSSLAEDRVVLDQMISQKILSSIDDLTLAQSKEFMNLNSFAQKLISDLVEQRKAQQINNDILAGKVDSFHSDMQLRFSDADRTMMREKVLESLFFPEIYLRRGEIKEPAPNTLKWLFESYAESSDGDRSQQRWSNFRQWLREDTSMYWISGKAGSGKSTLMAHIVNDERTLHDLDIWRQGHELKVLSFFFWRAGTRLQNSVLGLLRSLLYQLCRSQPLITDNILTRLSSPIGMIPIWTERSLLDHITKAVQSSTGFRFCVFIDGLDEYTGCYNDLVDHINLLQEFGNLKICASSRPELELVNKLQGLKQLRLQDLNRGDIQHFVQGSLGKTQLDQKERTDLAKQIVQRAEGVFLWASLVTQSLLKGIMAGDDQDIIQKRLNSLPEDMEQLFKRMLKDVDVVYQESLALYVQLKMIEREFDLDPFTISIIAILQLQKRIDSYEQFANECEKTELWITTRSAGLLEVCDHWAEDWKGHWEDDQEEEWEGWKTKFINNKPNFMPVADGLDRCRCAKNEPYPAMFKYDSRAMWWIHRSAFEFFSNLGEKASSFEPVLSREALFRKISESYISHLLAAPSCKVDYYIMAMVVRLRTFLEFVSKWYNEYPTTASALLDNMFSLCKRLEKTELLGAETYLWFHPGTDDFTGEIAFWSECAYTKNWPYISSRMGCISKRTDGSFLVAHLLAISVRWMPEGFDSLTETLLRLILQRLEIGGVDQTTAYKFIASAAQHCGYGPLLLGSFFVCASWREGVLDTSVSIMSRLIYIFSLPLINGPSSGLAFSFPVKKLPESFLTLMEITDLYVAPNLKLKQMSVQISANAWTQFCYSLSENEHDNRHGDCIEKLLISAIQVPRSVKLFCVPSFKKRPIPSTKYSATLQPVVELKDSQFISLHPSTTASSQLFSLFKCFDFTQSIEFYMTADSCKRREVCELLLQEIKSAELGLDGSQQLVAAACIQAGLLD